MRKTESDHQDNAEEDGLSDADIFRQAMQGVKPLQQVPKIEPNPTVRSVRRARTQSTFEVEPAPLSDFENLDPLAPESLVEYSQPGIPHKILRKLRGGQYNVEAILDLHGKTVENARESFYRFLLKCQSKGVSHVLIIHGKGRVSGHPILKNKLNHWLRQLPAVLAFCSAKAKDGLSGAMYVLLKQQKGR